MVWTPPPSGKRGRQQSYSDAAIQACLMMKVLLGVALRQTTGFVEGLLQLIGMSVQDSISQYCKHLAYRAAACAEATSDTAARLFHVGAFEKVENGFGETLLSAVQGTGELMKALMP